MKLYVLGKRVTMMNIGARQLAARGPNSQGKPGQVLKTVGAPAVNSPYANQVWATFTRAAIGARGKTMEGVNSAVAHALAGMDTGARARQAERRTQKMAEAEAHLRQFEAKSSGMGNYRSMQF